MEDSRASTPAHERTASGDGDALPPSPPADEQSASLSLPLFRLSPADLKSRRLSELSCSDEDFAFLDPADELSMEEQLMYTCERGRCPGPRPPIRETARRAPVSQVRGALLPRARGAARVGRVGGPPPVADVELRHAGRRAALREDGGEDGVLLSNREREGIRT